MACSFSLCLEIPLERLLGLWCAANMYEATMVVAGMGGLFDKGFNRVRWYIGLFAGYLGFMMMIWRLCGLLAAWECW